jgi:hypothetical protein
MSGDPAWLKALKKDAKKLGVSVHELMVKYDTKKLNTDKKKTKILKAAKGGLAKKKK